jgi:hypothetical protein
LGRCMVTEGSDSLGKLEQLARSNARDGSHSMPAPASDVAIVSA